MEHKPIPVPPGTFRTVLVPIGAVLSALAAICGLISVVLLFSPAALEDLIRDLYLSGITSGSALDTWKVIHIAVTAVCFLWAGLMTVQLWAMTLGRPGRGLLTLSTAAEWTVHGVNASGAVVLLIFLYKLIRYIIMCLGINEGAYLLYSMLVSEALMAAQAAFLFVLLKRFLNSLSDAAAGLARAVTSGTMGNRAIPGFAATGFGLLAAVELLIAGDRLFTVTIVDAFPQDYYALLTAESPLLLFSGCMFALCALVNVLLLILLRRYKRLGERLHFQENRLKK